MVSVAATARPEPEAENEAVEAAETDDKVEAESKAVEEVEPKPKANPKLSRKRRMEHLALMEVGEAEGGDVPKTSLKGRATCL